MSTYEYRVVSSTSTGSGAVHESLKDAQRALRLVRNLKRKGVKYHVERRQVGPWETVR